MPSCVKIKTLNQATIPEIPVYKPTVAEFEDFSKCISMIESLGAHHVGLCKVIPPSNWVGRRKGYDNIDECLVEKPICQSTYGGRGIYFQDISPRKSLKFSDFKNIALSSIYCTPKYRDYDHLERKYWSSIGTSRPLYGANVSGTLMDIDQHIWNIAKLDSVLSRVFEEEGVQIPGVNTPYLYYGMWRSTFPWHVEDVDLYSINYLHYGLPKCWHKCVLISPTVLSQSGIPTKKILQHEGEFMITFPYAYHSGFNMGLNIAESTNFALTRWIEYGKHAKICTCWDDTVKICMDPFVRRFQPELFNDWKSGKNLPPHPLDEYLPKETSHHVESTLTYPDSAKDILGIENNEVMAKDPSLFKPYSSDSPPPKVGDLNSIDLRGHREDKLPLYSEPHIPEVAYRSYNSSVQFPPTVKSRILRCFRCCLTVHARCYGVQDELGFKYESSLEQKHNLNFKRSWYCDACMASSKPTCVFCYMRGGAIKALANINNAFTGRPYWAHLVCALITPGCYFEDVPKRLAFISEDTIKSAMSSAILYSSESNKRVINEMQNISSPSCFSETVPFKSSSYLQKNLKLVRKRPPNIDNKILREYYESPDQRSKICRLNKSNNRFSRKLLNTTSTVSIDFNFKKIRPFIQNNNNGISSVHHSDNTNIPVETGDKIASSLPSICFVCQLPGRGFLPLASCWHNGCSTQFHVTCAQMAGIVIGTDVYPRFFYIACSKHPTNYDHNVNWFKDGPPEKGSLIKVLWDDGMEYAGTYEGTTSEQWEVQLESGEIRVFNREQFYVQPKTKYSDNLAFDGSSTDYPWAITDLEDSVAPSNS
ncbi:jumonji domain-containing protein 2 [Schistosoma bovis]|uniref:Jumonji domain-containing protein 2 n=1 Tax=Schistosoma bovis TaxID=6184 RepID=A0A430QEP7_SCHBO|nr:jumonji domain-containing protein 2 [Schistosoma bovis]